MGGLGQKLNSINWNGEQLRVFEKNFYIEHPAVSAMSDQEADAIRRGFKIEIRGRTCPKPIRSFVEGGFPEYLLDKVRAAGFERPTAIQVQGWPIALSGHDMIGVAETGSGKTVAFLLPALLHILAQPEMRPGEGPIMLCLVPTRELAQQIHEECIKFGSCMQVKSACLVGGQGTKHIQRQQLREPKEIIVATPGRLIDFLEEGATNLKRVTYLVLDEADCMLNLGFEPQLRKIAGQIRPDRQTLMWSATWPRDVARLARDLCREDPIEIRVNAPLDGGDRLKANPHVAQDFLFLEGAGPAERDRQVLRIIQDYHNEHRNRFKALVFVDKKRDCDTLVREIRNASNLEASALHGDKSQPERDAALQRFKSGSVQILVATDVASRGLHVDDVSVVINRDFPKELQTYVHRIGRTGRAGNSGCAVSLVDAYVDFSSQDVARQVVNLLQAAEQKVPKTLLERAGLSVNTQQHRSDDQGSFGGGNDNRGGYGNNDNNNRGGNFGGFGNNDNNRGNFGGNDNRGGYGNNDNNNRGNFGGSSNDNRGNFGGNDNNNRGGFGGSSNDNRGSFGGIDNNRGSFGGNDSNNRGGYGGIDNNRGGFGGFGGSNDNNNNSRGGYGGNDNNNRGGFGSNNDNRGSFGGNDNNRNNNHGERDRSDRYY